jgi:hypothetical protein
MTTYEEQFDPPRTYIDFMGARLPQSEVSLSLAQLGVERAKGLGFNVEFVAVVTSDGCADLCFMFRQKYADDIYVVMTADAEQERFHRWFHFSPLDSGSPRVR